MGDRNHREVAAEHVSRGYSFGGWWISPEGELHYVDDCSHSRVIERLGHDGYYAGYRAGFLRVSACSLHYGQPKVNVSFTPGTVQRPTIQALAEALREIEQTKPDVSFAASCDFEEFDRYDREKHYRDGLDGAGVLRFVRQHNPEPVALAA